MALEQRLTLCLSRRCGIALFGCIYMTFTWHSKWFIAISPPPTPASLPNPTVFLPTPLPSQWNVSLLYVHTRVLSSIPITLHAPSPSTLNPASSPWLVISLAVLSLCRSLHALQQEVSIEAGLISRSTSTQTQDCIRWTRIGTSSNWIIAKCL